jgi:hypothetical protein
VCPFLAAELARLKRQGTGSSCGENLIPKVVVLIYLVRPVLRRGGVREPPATSFLPDKLGHVGIGLREAADFALGAGGLPELDLVESSRAALADGGVLVWHQVPTGAVLALDLADLIHVAARRAGIAI